MKLDPDLRRGIILSHCTDGGLVLSATGILWSLSHSPAWWLWLIDIPMLIGIACCLVLGRNTRATIHEIQQLRDDTERMRAVIRRFRESQ